MIKSIFKKIDFLGSQRLSLFLDRIYDFFTLLNRIYDFFT